MREAIQHYEGALMREAGGSLDQVNFAQVESISKIYSETFMKLYNTKMASCDWNHHQEFIEHLKQILMK